MYTLMLQVFFGRDPMDLLEWMVVLEAQEKRYTHALTALAAWIVLSCSIAKLRTLGLSRTHASLSKSTVAGTAACTIFANAERRSSVDQS